MNKNPDKQPQRESRLWVEIPKAPVELINRMLSRYIFRINETKENRRGNTNSLVLRGNSGEALLIFDKSKKVSETVILSFFLNDSNHSSDTLMMDGLKLAADKWPGNAVYIILDAQHENTDNLAMFFNHLGWNESRPDSHLIKFETLLKSKS